MMKMRSKFIASIAILYKYNQVPPFHMTQKAKKEKPGHQSVMCN